ncbi:MAG: amidohydrolase family protein [Bryobacteraceae bacterium]
MKKFISLFVPGLTLLISGFVTATFLRSSAHTPPLSAPELDAFTAIRPIDTHAHAFRPDSSFYAMMDRLHLHILDICVANRNDPSFPNLSLKINAAKAFVKGSNGHAVLCTTFDPFKFSDAAFARQAIQQLNADFADGAVAVKIWKNIGMELKNSKGAFVLPDDPRLEPIYQDIADHGKTLVAHLAEPDSCWQPPNKNSPDYSYYQKHPEWYMYTKPDHPSKQAILQARDHLLEKNPQLRVVGAHLGSMETSLDEIGRHLDRYPNFAVDMAARVIYLASQPRDKVRQFLIKYQDRILYATDLEFYPRQKTEQSIADWQTRYMTDWKFFSTDAMVDYQGHKVRGLRLPEQVLRKIFHENALRWVPGIAPQ